MTADGGATFGVKKGGPRCAIAAEGHSRGTPPALVAGVWKNITPPTMNVASSFGTSMIAIDPSHTATLYVNSDLQGIFKTTDGGNTWRVAGNPSGQRQGLKIDYLAQANNMAVDPCDSRHVYATSAVGGTQFGFWSSRDGGDSWVQTQGFADVAKETTADVSSMSVDPADFSHVLVASHSPWKDHPNAGVLETKNGGESWTIHPPQGSWPVGTAAVHFLYDPARGVGDANTWLVSTSGDGIWRTTNAGASWTRVSSFDGVHSGVDMYRTDAGVLYLGSSPYPVRSADNGVTWEQVKSALPYSYYLAVHGDGKLLYTMPSLAVKGAPLDSPYWVSPEGDGATWKALGGGAQKLTNGPSRFVFDPVNRIMYSSNWAAGVWALKVKD